MRVRERNRPDNTLRDASEVMNLIHKTKRRYLVSLTPDELIGISNALNEVCHGVHIDDAEFKTRLAYPRADLAATLQRVGESLAAANAEDMEILDAWSDGGSVQVRAISATGDPVDMSTEEALSFAAQITRCAHEADTA